MFVPFTPFVHSRQPDLETESLKNQTLFLYHYTRIIELPRTTKQLQVLCFKRKAEHLF